MCSCESGQEENTDKINRYGRLILRDGCPFSIKDIEVLSIKDDDGNTIKEKTYRFGNCIIDVLYGPAIIEKSRIVEIDASLKAKVTALLEKCDDYLHNDIMSMIETDLAFIFDEKYSYKNEFFENKLCTVYFFDNIHQLICLLLINIYFSKLMYKRCEHCHQFFATRISNMMFCKRIATKNGKTCRYAHALELRRKKHTSSEL